MKAIVRLYSDKQGEILNFLNTFSKNNSLSQEPSHTDNKIAIENDLLWQKEYENPLEIADIIGALIENQEDYKINMWVSLDKDLFINITSKNADEVIRYLYERYPY